MNARLMALVLALMLCIGCAAANAEETSALNLPALTVTDCEWDENGNLIAEVAHTPDGTPAVNARGFHRAEYTWDESNNPLSEAYYGLNGELVTADGGYASVEFVWTKDSNGGNQLVSEQRYAPDGSPANIPGSYTAMRNTYGRDLDESYDPDELLATEFFGADGALVRPDGGYAQIVYEVTEDETTKTVVKRYLDAEGNALIGTEGGAKVVSVYTAEDFLHNDEPTATMDAENIKSDGHRAEGTVKKNLLLSQEIFSTTDEAILGSGRFHRQVNTYDDHGNLTRTDYYGNDGEPIRSSNGYASVTHVYDDLDRVIETSYLGTDGQLIKMINGYARFTLEYHGSSTRVHYRTFFGTDGARTMTTEGSSRIQNEYDGGDWDYQETHYDTLDELTMHMNGYCRLEKKYHRERYQSEDGTERWIVNPDATEWEKRFGTDLNLIRIKAGYSGYVNEFNGNDQVIKTTYMDDQWQPVRNDELQYAWITYEYNTTAKDAPPCFEAYFDQFGIPCENVNGAYARAVTYGGPKQNLLIEEAFFTSDRTPDVSVLTGAHRVVNHYSKNLLLDGAAYYDEDGNLMETSSGYASLMREYNTDGQLLWEITLDPQGKPVNAGGVGAAQVHTYDYAGRHTGEKFFAADGSALTQASGYASVTYDYDHDGNVNTISYFNAAGDPVLVNGWAKVVRKYDDNHHMTRESFYGADKRPIVLAEGYSARTMAYDETTGLLARVNYLNPAHAPQMLPAGYASYEQRYDVNGILLYRAYFDAAGDPVVPNGVGYASFERTVDRNGNVQREAHYDAQGQLIVNTDGYAILQREYDLHNNMTMEAYLDGNGQYADTRFGYSVKSMAYDDMDRKTAEAYFGMQMQAVNGQDGYHQVTWDYDYEGRLIQEAYQNDQGQPTLCPDGYARFILE